MGRSFPRALATLFLASFASPALPWAAPGTGMAGTAHDALRAGGKSSCGVCHVFNKAGAATLLWSPDAKPQSDKPMGSSTRCLACHDGTMAGSGGTTGHGHRSGEHPVGVPFPFQGAPSTYGGSTSGEMAMGSRWVANPVALGIKLFSEMGGELLTHAVVGRTGIECSSCHDIHNGSQVQDEHLLRGKRGGNATGASGYLCLKCHATA